MRSDSSSDGFAEDLTEQDRALLSRLADRIVHLRMSAPAILFLESVRPLNFVGSQMMVFLAPIVRGFFGLPEWDRVSRILEQRESVTYFLDLIEEREGIFMWEQKKRREEEKSEKPKRRRRLFGKG